MHLNIECVSSEELHVPDHECVLSDLSFSSDSLLRKCVPLAFLIILNLSAEKFSTDFVSSAALSSQTDIDSSVHSIHTALQFWIK